MKASLKSLIDNDNIAPVQRQPKQVVPKKPHSQVAPSRTNTRQISAHFQPEVAQTLRLIAVEQDKDIQEILAEALNMVFARYGKAARAEVASGRRRSRNTSADEANNVEGPE